MKIVVDLTGEDFADNVKVNFYDSKTIFFEPVNILPSLVKFKIWGADISDTFPWHEYALANAEENFQKFNKQRLTIKGNAQLMFEQVVAGKVEISPYVEGNFIKKSNGETLTYKREWNLDKIDSQSMEYWLDTHIYFPYGACDLKLYAKGKVSFEFDTKDCINYLDYITDKKRNETFWGYLKDKTLTTNSYHYEELDPQKSRKT